jgi:hypothetical protein
VDRFQRGDENLRQDKRRKGEEGNGKRLKGDGKSAYFTIPFLPITLFS